MTDVKRPVFTTEKGRRTQIGTASYAAGELRHQILSGVYLPPTFTLSTTVGTAGVTVEFTVTDGALVVTDLRYTGIVTAQVRREVDRQMGGWEIATVEALLESGPYLQPNSHDEDGNPTFTFSSGGSGVIVMPPEELPRKVVNAAVDTVRAPARKGRPGRWTPEYYAEMAEVFKAFTARGESGYQAVATKAGISYQSAKNRMAEARERGLLPRPGE